MALLPTLDQVQVARGLQAMHRELDEVEREDAARAGKMPPVVAVPRTCHWCFEEWPCRTVTWCQRILAAWYADRRMAVASRGLR